MNNGHLFVQYLDIVVGDVIVKFERIYVSKRKGEVIVGKGFLISSDS